MRGENLIMIKRRLGKSDLYASVIGYGAWKVSKVMWEGINDKTSLYSMDCAIDHGINYFDTAPAYGYGHSEDLVGRAVKGKRDSVILATKVGKRWDQTDTPVSEQSKNAQLKVRKDLSKESVLWEIDQSLKRLGTDYIDLIQIHWNDNRTDLHETMEAFIKARDAGKVRYFGVCNLGIDNLDKVRQVDEISTIQVLYNMIDRNTEIFLGSKLEYRTESEILPYCKQNQISLIPYCPLARSWLTEVRDPVIPVDYPVYWDASVKDKMLELRDRFAEEAEQKGLKLSEYALQWLVRQEVIGTVIIGSVNPQHIKANVAAAEALESLELVR